MKIIENPEFLFDDLEQRIDKLLFDGKSLFGRKESFLNKKIDVLYDVRVRVYENLNQFQHEYLLVNALEWFQANETIPKSPQWSWNPSSTGTAEEPDLRLVCDGQIILSAEATASSSPKGTIDTRMRNTLVNLSQMKGKKYYFVTTAPMEKRAKTKIRKMDKVSINVVLLPTCLKKWPSKK